MPRNARNRTGTGKRGVGASETRELLVSLDGVVTGRSYGFQAFLVNGHFFARFRDQDTVLVVRLASIDDRDVLMQLDPAVFFFTDHYRNHPAVLIHLDRVPRPLLTDVLKQAWQHARTKKPKPPKASRR